MTISSASDVTPKTIDLSWVEFSEQEDECCTSLLGCSKQATWKTIMQHDNPSGCGAPMVYYFCEECGVAQQEVYSSSVRGWGKGMCAECWGDLTILKHYRYRKL